MSDQPIYRSSNGDDWFLKTDPRTGETVVVHRPNASSGGAESTTSAKEFLERGGGGPETQAVRDVLERSKG